MKTTLLLLFLSLFSNLLIAQTTSIPDANFEQALIDLGHDTGIPDGLVTTADIETITSLIIFSKNISSLIGIEDFTALTTLNCSDNQLSSLNVTQNTALTILACNNNQLTSLDLNQNTALTILVCNNNQLSSLDLTHNTALTELECRSNQLSNLDLTQNIALTIVACTSNQLSSLDLTYNTSLLDLYCYDNQLISLDLTQNTALTELGCWNNQLSSLDLTQNTVLTYLRCYDNNLTCLKQKNLIYINFFDLDARNNPNLNCIEVDSVAYSTSNWTDIDVGVSFSTNCPDQCVVGIDDIETSLEFSIYPNPTKGNIYINLGENKTSLNTILSNSLGQVISTQEFEHTDNIIININASAGIYFLRIETM